MDQGLVLIADDEQDIRDFMRTLVGFFGYRSITAQDGQQAIAAALVHKPTLILMDLSMPNLDGFKAIARLKADPLTNKIPIIAFSGLYMDAPVRARLLDAGCSDFLPKPIDTNQLYSSVTMAVRGKKPEVPRKEDAPLPIKKKHGNDRRKSIKRLIGFFK